MTFQERLITLRKQQGLSQEQLGYELGVTRQTVSKWELGVTTPEMDKLIQLSDFFHISIDELVGHTSPEPASKAPETDYAQTAREIHYVPYHWHYEYKSRLSIFGLPLVHINVGRWFPGQKFCRARGVLAIGGFAFGLFAAGGCAIGVYSIGGLAVAQKIAAGGAAYAPIAIGDAASGEMVFDINSPISPEVIRQVILQRFPETRDIIIRLFSMTVSG
ncbi:MAG TPA: helix-turn-helix domain-containing protein [Candidatus Mediterraneibacter intestinigallinarum]|nr:helix-turn-helix domain-containing protein [Candidatus Mediterraneibacter intestinigallinarum]